MNWNYFIMASSIQKNTIRTRWEVRQIMKIALFRSTYRNSLIYPVTYKFYFGILMRVANEISCESHRSMTIKFIRREGP